MGDYLGTSGAADMGSDTAAFQHHSSKRSVSFLQVVVKPRCLSKVEHLQRAQQTPIGGSKYFFVCHKKELMVIFVSKFEVSVGELLVGTATVLKLEICGHYYKIYDVVYTPS